MGIEDIKEVYKKKSGEVELLRKKAVKDTLKMLDKFRNEIFFEEVYLFGSVTEPRHFHEYSDIDIAFRGLDRDNLFYAVAYLSRYLEREVNVVHIEDIHFKEKIFRKGMKWKRD